MDRAGGPTVRHAYRHASLARVLLGSIRGGAPSAGFLQYLHKILEPNEPSPTSPTSSATFTPARFSTGHLHALAALLGNKGRDAAWTRHFGNVGARDRGVALQAWLYHLLGGEASGLKMPTDWKSSTSSKRLLARAEKSVAAAAKERSRWAQAAVQLRGLDLAKQLRAGAQLGWRMVEEAVVTELAMLGAGWFAPPDAKRVSAPVAAPASVSPEGRVWQLTEELRAERAHSDEMRIELETSQRELQRVLRREECGAAAVVAEGAWAELQIKMMAQEHEVHRPPKRESRAPSSPLLTSPSHPSHAGRDARASRRVQLQGAQDDENAQGGRD